MRPELIAAVALGGALGAVMRYAVYLAADALLASRFPWATLTVNTLGSLVMGSFAAIVTVRGVVPPELRAFLAVGILGSFTTFSTFSLDVVTLVERGRMTMAVVYVAGSLVLSLSGFLAGASLARRFL